MIQNKRYQVFLSSTYSDLKDVRDSITRSIMELGSIPAGMEAFPAADEEQFEFIKKVIDDSDYYVVILAGRYGSLDRDGVSFTEKEFNYALESQIPILAYVHDDPRSFGGSQSDLQDDKKAENFFRFRQRLLDGRMAKVWNDKNILVTQVILGLTRAFQTKPRTGWVRGDLAVDTETLQKYVLSTAENADLRKQVDALKERKSNLGEIAGLEALIDIEVSQSWRGDRGTLNRKTTSHKASLEALFRELGPNIIEPLHENSVSNLLAQKAVGDDKVYRAVPESFKLERESYNTLRLQLEELGLVTVGRSKTVSGTYAVFWQLTPNGLATTKSLRLIKRD